MCFDDEKREFTVQIDRFNKMGFDTVVRRFIFSMIFFKL